MATPRTVAFHTLGCKLNYSETSALSRLFEQNGYLPVKFGEEADIFVLNTCSVTEQADKECKKIVRQALRSNPEAFVVVTGCYAQLKPQEIADIPGVDLVLGAGEKFRMLEYIDDLSKAQGKGMVQAGEVRDVNTFVSSFSFGDRTRSFLKVQDGCDYKCSFCTIPQARGASRSDSVEQVLQNARQIASMGVKEIVLTGVNLGDFGNGTAVIEEDRPKKEALFVDLVEALDRLEEVSRFRISSIEPNLLTEEIIELVGKSKRFMPHFHVPLQSGNDKQLREMRRRYKRSLYADRVDWIKKHLPHACIGCDVIVGFPGETEADFMETYSFLSELPISYLHVFTYSERANTPAATMPGVVPVEERRRRNQALRGLSEMKRRAFYQEFIGTTRPVLFEHHKNEQFMTGFTDNYLKIEAPLQVELINQLALVELQDWTSDAESIRAVPSEKSRFTALFSSFLLVLLPLFGSNLSAQGTISLEEVLERALSNSAQIKKAQLERQAVDIRIKEQRSAAYPQVKAGVNFDAFPVLPTQLIPGEVLGRPDGSFVPVQFGRPLQLTGSLTAEQILYSESGRRMAPLATTTRTAADLLLQRSEEEVVFQTATIWYQMLQTTQLLRSIDSNLEKMVSIKAMAELQLANGYITTTDVKRIKVALTNLETQRQNLLNSIGALKETIQLLCGIPFDQGLEPAAALEEPAADSSTWLGLTLQPELTTELRLLSTQENMFSTQLQAAKADNWPTLSAYATGWAQNQRNNLLYFVSKRWYGMAAVGIKASVNLLDGNRRKHKMSILQLEIQKVREDLRQVELLKTMEFRQAKVQLTTALSGLRVQAENVDLAKEITDKLALRYKSGEVPLTDLLNAQTAHSEAETHYWQQVFAYKLAVLRLAKASGQLELLRGKKESSKQK
jgi:threonylcarbamoyladenosine tRNA methylthiotransferase MtaB